LLDATKICCVDLGCTRRQHSKSHAQENKPDHALQKKRFYHPPPAHQSFLTIVFARVFHHPVASAAQDAIRRLVEASECTLPKDIPACQPNNQSEKTPFFRTVRLSTTYNFDFITYLIFLDLDDPRIFLPSQIMQWHSPFYRVKAGGSIDHDNVLKSQDSFIFDKAKRQEGIIQHPRFS